MDQKNLKEPTYQPVIKSERLQSMDILRGVALLGILMINIEFFAQPFEKLINPALSNDFVGLNYYMLYKTRFNSERPTGIPVRQTRSVYTALRDVESERDVS